MARLDQILAQMPSMSDAQLQNMSVIENGPVGVKAKELLASRQTGLGPMMTDAGKTAKTDIPNTQLQKIQGVVPETAQPSLLDMVQMQAASRPHIGSGDIGGNAFLGDRARGPVAPPAERPSPGDIAAFANQGGGEPQYPMPGQEAPPAAGGLSGLAPPVAAPGTDPSAYAAMDFAAPPPSAAPKRRGVAGAAPAPDRSGIAALRNQSVLQSTPYAEERPGAGMGLAEMGPGRSLSEAMAPDPGPLPSNSLMLAGQPEGPAPGEIAQNPNAPDPSQPGHKTDPTADPLRQERGMALMAAGLGTLASNSRNGALGALGEGGLAGLRYYQNAKRDHTQTERYAKQDMRDDRRFDMDIAWREQQAAIAREKMALDREELAAKRPLLEADLELKRSGAVENYAQADRARRGPVSNGRPVDGEMRDLKLRKAEADLEYKKTQIEKARSGGGSGRREDMNDNQEYSKLRDVMKDADKAVDAHIESLPPSKQREAQAQRDALVAAKIRDMGYDKGKLEGRMRQLVGSDVAATAAPAANNDPLGLRK